jgi:hypothetical protein
MWGRKLLVDLSDFNIEGGVSPGGTNDGKANGK